MIMLSVLLGAVAPAGALAATTETLKTYLRETGSVRAHFSQVVFDRNMRKLQETSGTMQFLRPGRIRWSYERPFEQLIVGDGKELWIYDKDLNQVTVKVLKDAIGGSPAALLAGGQDIERDFIVTPAGSQDGIEWLDAVPRSAESTFQKVRLGFGKTGLEAMELHDSFGQLTLIRFSRVERNPVLAPELFRFTPPPGADVIRG